MHAGFWLKTALRCMSQQLISWQPELPDQAGEKIQREGTEVLSHQGFFVVVCLFCNLIFQVTSCYFAIFYSTKFSNSDIHSGGVDYKKGMDIRREYH